MERSKSWVSCRKNDAQKIHYPPPEKVMFALYHLELRACALVARNCALDQTIGVSLRSVHFCVCTSVLQALEPAEICKKFTSVIVRSQREKQDQPTNLKVVLVRQAIIHRLNPRHRFQNLL